MKGPSDRKNQRVFFYAEKKAADFVGFLKRVCKIFLKEYTIKKIVPYITFTNKYFLIKYLMRINCIHKSVVCSFMRGEVI